MHVAERARWFLFSPQGRMTLVVLYVIASVISIVTYTIRYSPLYGAGQLGLTGFGLLWTRWCLHRV
jgi:hypothetical protein